MFWGKLFILSCLWCAHTGRMVTDRWPQSLLGHTSCQGPNPWGSPVPDGGGYCPRFVLRGQGPGEGLLWPLELQHQSWARSRPSPGHIPGANTPVALGKRRWDMGARGVRAVPRWDLGSVWVPWSSRGLSAPARC